MNALFETKSDKKAQELWASQYPYGGFCFGPGKPTVHIVQERGKQVIRFEGSSMNGEIHHCLYPGFSFKHWTDFVYDQMGISWLNQLGINDQHPEIRQLASDAIEVLIDRRSPGEIAFWKSYFDQLSHAQTGYGADGVWEAPEWIPAIIPQVWIQWHSETVSDLRTSGSPYTSQPQRIDFAVFWNYKRHAILIDGIQHYGIKHNNVWEAREEEYAKRLAEDRFLRTNGWEVFRVSNWELRDQERTERIIREFENHIGFEFR